MVEKKVLERRISLFAEEHPDIVKTRADLTETFQRQEQRVEAVKLGEKVLEARRGIFGREHPRTMSSIAITYQKLGMGDESVRLLERTVEARRRILGAKHPVSLWTMTNLAISYPQERLYESVDLLE